MAGTSDTKMNQLLNIISTKVHGKDIRGAIHDGLEYIFNKSFEWNDATTKNVKVAKEDATKALAAANLAKSQLDPMADEIEELRDDLNTTDARVSTIIANGIPTEGNTELIDIRTAGDGMVSTTAGDAVRRQFKVLNARVNTLENPERRTGVVQYRPDAMFSHDTYIYTNNSPTSDLSEKTVEIGTINGQIDHWFCGFNIYYKIHKSDTDIHVAHLLPNPTNRSGSLIISQEVLIDGTYQRVERAIEHDNSSNGRIYIRNAYVFNNNLNWSLNGSDLAISNQPATKSINNSYIIITSIASVKQTFEGQSITVSKDSELMDLRVDNDGTTWPTAGDCVRHMVQGGGGGLYISRQPKVIGKFNLPLSGLMKNPDEEHDVYEVTMFKQDITATVGNTVSFFLEEFIDSSRHIILDVNAAMLKYGNPWSAMAGNNGWVTVPNPKITMSGDDYRLICECPEASKYAVMIATIRYVEDVKEN